MNLSSFKKNLPTLWVFGLLGLLGLTFVFQMFFHSREKLTSKEQYAIRQCTKSTNNANLSEVIKCLQLKQQQLSGTPPTPTPTPTTPTPPPPTTALPGRS
jgi:type IV secretory pathway VirB10-like protein